MPNTHTYHPLRHIANAIVEGWEFRYGDGYPKYLPHWMERLVDWVYNLAIHHS